MQCPRKYYYRYVMGLEGRPSIHLVVGGVVHSAIEFFHNMEVGPVASRDFFETLHSGMMDFFERNWEERGDELGKLGLSPAVLRFHHDEASFMLDNFFRHHTGRVVAEQYRHNLSPWEAFKKLKPKTETKIVSEKFGVVGVLDAIHDVNGKNTVIDYKTSKKNEIDQDCLVQLSVYAVLHREHFGRLPDRVGIHFLRHGEKVIRVGPELLALGEKKCEEIRSLTRSDAVEDYPRKKSGLCKFRTGQCDYYEACKPWNSAEFG